MGGRLRPLLVVAVLVAVVAAGVLALRACRIGQSAGEQAASFSAENVPTSSPDLAVEAASVRGELHPGYMEWACLLRCKDPDGCSAEVRITVRFTSAGEPEKAIFTGTVDVPIGARARIGGIQRPPRRVDSVEHVDVRVERRITAGEPVPTPEY